MAKIVKAPSGQFVAEVTPSGETVVRDEKTGKSVTVKGVGALKDNGLRIKAGVNLLKPIAEQTLARRSKKRKIGMKASDARKAG